MVEEGTVGLTAATTGTLAGVRPRLDSVVDMDVSSCGAISRIPRLTEGESGWNVSLDAANMFTCHSKREI